MAPTLRLLAATLLSAIAGRADALGRDRLVRDEVAGTYGLYRYDGAALPRRYLTVSGACSGIVVALLVSACVRPDLGPEVHPLHFSASLPRTTIQLGESATLTFELRNLADTMVVLGFSSGCQIVPTIRPAYVGRTRPGTEPGLFPTCITYPTALGLPPSGREVVRLAVRGGPHRREARTSAPNRGRATSKTGMEGGSAGRKGIVTAVSPRRVDRPAARAVDCAARS